MSRTKHDRPPRKKIANEVVSRPPTERWELVWKHPPPEGSMALYDNLATLCRRLARWRLLLNYDVFIDGPGQAVLLSFAVTQGRWSKAVRDELREAYPNAAPRRKETYHNPREVRSFERMPAYMARKGIDSPPQSPSPVSTRGLRPDGKK